MSKKIKISVVGIGLMGLQHIKAIKKSKLSSLHSNYEIKKTSENKSLLIFDEVMSGFRVSLGGAQELYKIKPDLTTLGKVIGGGLPVGAFGGKKKIMDFLAPNGPVYQAGTLSGNPLAMAAGSMLIKLLIKTNPYKKLEDKAANLLQGMKNVFDANDIPFSVNQLGGMFGFFFWLAP